MPISTITPASLGGVPAFSAYQSVAQTLTLNVATKITFTTTEFDTTGGMYSSSRFTPTVAGYYQVTGAITVSTTVTRIYLSLYKNGSVFKTGFDSSSNAGTGSMTALIYLNGSTDYVEFYGLIGATQALAAQPYQTYFQASMVRSA